MEVVKIRLKGLAPLLMHSARLADPSDAFALAIKAITSKRKKTESDAAEIHWLEWCGGLYLQDYLSGPSVAEKFVSVPIIPAANLIGFIQDGAKASRQGQDVLRGADVIENAALEKTGWPKNKTLRQIFDMRTYVDIRGIVNPSTGGRTMRCRPIFKEWEASFAVMMDPATLNRKDIMNFATTGGAQKGICDYKPKFGRCEAEDAA
jgi:hypothetical protein